MPQWAPHGGLFRHYLFSLSLMPALGAEALTDEKTEAQRGQTASWRSHSKKPPQGRALTQSDSKAPCTWCGRVAHRPPPGKASKPSRSMAVSCEERVPMVREGKT